MPDGIDRVHLLGEGHHGSCRPQRGLVDRLHVHIGAIEHRKAGIAPLEREEEIGPTEQNDLGALLPTQALAGGEEHAPLRIIEVPYIKRKHNEIPEKLVKGNSKVKSLSYCDKCHQKADANSFDDDTVNIPGHGDWTW